MAGILNGPQIRKLMLESDFYDAMNHKNNKFTPTFSGNFVDENI